MVPSSFSTYVTLFLVYSRSVQAVDETVWSAFAYVLNGERTPLHGPGTAQGRLTSLGAQQMLSQGSLLRTRWLTNGTSAGKDTNATTIAPIANIEKRAIDNDQLSIYSSRDDHVTAGALAFMQGLYPPQTQTFAVNNGGINASVLANGSLVDFPLDGYMYPNIQTLSLSDSESVWLEGHVTCTNYLRATGSIRSNPRIAEKWNSSYPQYQKLWSTVFAGTFPLAAATFDSAYDLYDYASFQYTHNKTIRTDLNVYELDWLHEFASIQQFAKNGDLTVSGAEEGDMIRAVSGRTLATKVIRQFQSHISTAGEYPKINLMFGNFQPMLAFFSLSGLSNGPSSGLFQEIPGPGGAMVFELFSEGMGTTSFPSTSDLWVRFLYRNSTDDSARMWEYPLFGLGNSETRIKYDDFVSNVLRFSINDIPTWCNTCDAVSTFCGTSRQVSEGSRTSGNSKDMNLSPAIAGVIGALMAIAVIAVAAVLLFVFGRFGFHRRPPGQKSIMGGFKGAKKMASDQDLSVAESGAKKERIGSWELGKTPQPVVSFSQGGSPGNEPVFGATHMRNIDDDNDSIIMGRQPVKPRESF